MKIYVNASVLLRPHGGIGVYTREILRRLPQLAPDASFRIFLGQGWSGAESLSALLESPLAGASKDLSLVDLARQVPGARDLWNFYKRIKFENGISRGASMRFWEPCFIPPGDADNSTITVHDLSHVRYPEYHPTDRVKWLRKLPHALQASQRVIAVSEFTKREIVDVYGVEESKITVIPNGLADAYQQNAMIDGEQTVKKFDLEPGKYFLSACTLEPRKNLATAVRAFAQLPQGIREISTFVLVGAAGWGESSQRAALESLSPNGGLKFTGYIPDSELAALYSHAAAFIYPSVYEGFGIPVIEAMACGAPVLASDAKALVEVASGHARHIRADDIDGWTAGMLWGLNLSPKDRTDITTSASAHAKTYTWDDIARRTLEVIVS